MAAGVVLDTSFLITLADPERKNHGAAVGYWRHFTENGVPLYLPTIVVSEFCVKQEIPLEILRSCVVLPFNWEDAMKAATLDFSGNPRAGTSRAELKDDVKIIAQALVKDAKWIITDDVKSLYRYVTNLRETGKTILCPIKLNDGFDVSLLDPSGQRLLSYEVEPEEPSE